MVYTTLAKVRATSGIGIDLINDNDGITILTGVEASIEKYLNTKFIPTDTFEILNGTGTERLSLSKSPVLNVLAVRIGDTDISTNYVDFLKSGVLILTDSAEESSWKITKPLYCKIKYRYGLVNKSNISSTIDAAESSGSSVVVVVADGSLFSDNDWVMIESMDGKIETTQIISGGTTEDLVMNLSYDHEAGSIITLLEVPPDVDRFAQVCCALAFVSRVVGESYTDIVGYDIGDFHVQKGEPYTQWRETATQLFREKTELMKNIGVRTFVF